MKNLLLTLLVSALTLGWAAAQAPKASPRVTEEGKNVSIAYGQPSKKGRVIFGELEAYGKVWRTGANEGTEITFKKDGKFGGKAVKAGTYTLFTIPGEKEWSIILNSELKQWGAYNYDKIKAKNVVEVKVPAKKFSDVAEKLTFKVSDDALQMQWDKEGFSVPLSF